MNSVKSNQSKPEILILLNLRNCFYSNKSTVFDLQLPWCFVEILRSESKIKLVEGSIWNRKRLKYQERLYFLFSCFKGIF